MTPDQITLVRSVFEDLARAGLEPVRVYERLFELHPELRDRFPEDLGGLPRNFWTGLTGLVVRLDDVAGLTAEAAAAAAYHRNMGVNSVEFTYLGEAVDDVIQSTLGAAYTPAHREAFARTWSLVTEIMQQRPRTPAAAIF